ncbi:UDP-N-acetylmuramoyl-tripeptide--D-alanyl-D-alanine ligase [Marinospirillum celere]|uniref:UDP-N-acetylmuramoyl-tripeptide--D-alanyl-D-alanine ligase n=1 Tax=Marinospirillum celere TaxID=1122252 RepID=A0A1I1G5P3_9GAMM|nr:UDP-N-acetylmuramoyl-tripeptide--D-alanyl-D-alanine ligase [Marinospirillum celere]SFC04510.1 UDP-N-acetylmuramoyl-tripeptide--D-alanyl-D-alanine ligase [Marinospirillum celere]
MMQSLTLDFLAGLLDGQIRGAQENTFCRVVTDTRQTSDQALFVALQGPRFDGHDFIAAAREAGASAALVERWVDDPLPQVKVASSLQALGQLAAWNRQAFKGPVVGVTGNSGKTTVKEMLAAMLRLDRGSVLATPGNLNNAIGLPLTLLSLEPQHQAAVIELGANHLGEIDYLASLTRPDLGVITNVTGAHLGEFGSLEAIAQAKGELLAWLPNDGVSVLNAEDVFFDFWRKQSLCPITSFGIRQGDVRAEDLHTDALGNSQFTAVTPWGRQVVHLALPGRHNLSNALASMALAGHLGIVLEVQAQALAEMQSVKGRLQRINAYGDALLLDDSYNASPGAVKSAIDLLASLPGKRLLALGALAELGDASAAIHSQLGGYAREQKLDGLYVLAGAAEAAASAFGQEARVFADHSALAEALKPHLDRETCLLVKGSRSARMDLLVTLLRKEETGA